MSNVIPFPIFCEDKEKEKEFNFDFPEILDEKENSWPIKQRHLDNPNLDFDESYLLSIVENMSTKMGWCFASNKKLQSLRKCSDDFISKILKNLARKGYIWLYYHPSKRGKRREIVTHMSAAKYYSYQIQNGFTFKAKKVHDEFLVKIGKEKLIKEKIKSPLPTPINTVKEKITTRCERVGPTRCERVALETTSTNIDYLKSDVHVRQETALFLKKDLREELTKTFQDPKLVIYGMRWLELLPNEKREKLDCEIKSAIAAVKGGYAKEKVDEYDNKKIEEEQKKIKQSQEIEEKINAQKALSNRNVKFAVAINNCFKSFKALKIMYDNKTFRIVHECLPEKQDEEGMIYRILPNGEKFYGKPSLFISFDKPYENNYQESIKFFKSVMNIEEKEFKNILSQGIQYASH